MRNEVTRMNRNRSVYGAEDLSSRAINVYRYLNDRANKDGTCYPAIKTIAKDLKISVNTVKRAVNDLVAHGYITKNQRWRENGGRSSLLFTILPQRGESAL